MSLIYVCTDYDLTGPSPRERARIGLLLSALMELKLQVATKLENSNHPDDNNTLSGELMFIESEMSELCKLLPDRTKNEVEIDLWRDRERLLG